MTKILQRRKAESPLFYSVTEINFPYICRSAIFFHGVFDAMSINLRDKSIVTNALHNIVPLPAQVSCA